MQAKAHLELLKIWDLQLWRCSVLSKCCLVNKCTGIAAVHLSAEYTKTRGAINGAEASKDRFPFWPATAAPIPSDAKFVFSTFLAKKTAVHGGHGGLRSRIIRG